MSQEKIQFSLVLNEDDGIDMNIEGSMSELIQLIASAIVHEPEIEKVIMLALFTAQNHGLTDSEESEEEALGRLFESIKPTAEA